jgi:hypothetical protein
VGGVVRVADELPIQLQHGYADVAYLPKPQGEGTALLITGTNTSSINAGGHFLTDEQVVARLLQMLKRGTNDPIPASKSC